MPYSIPITGLSSKMIVSELANEFSETILPIAALLGFIVGGFFTYELLIFSNNDLHITIKAASLFSLGALAPGIIGFLLCARVSSSLATELQASYIQGNTQTHQFRKHRLITLGLGAFVACITYQALAIVGTLIAAELALPGASAQTLELLLLERHPLAWFGDAFLAGLMGAAIGHSAMLAASQGSRLQREISRTAGRAVSYGLVAVCLIAMLYWILRQAA